ncbi:hypothetical protein AB0F11_30250 [Streptomyces sp. NPDC032472]|uniref:hypothetical protein n=1 Tax=Streptomyces sp. NPDC032472 TaxID=3155018 RepID=UPI0033CB9725
MRGLDPLDPLDPLDVDEDVPAAVEARLGEMLERRVAEAAATDPVLRRGRPALHVVLDDQYGTAGRELPCGTFGGAAAELAGDLALGWADDAFAECLHGSPAAARAYAIWRAMRAEMVAGQYLDLRIQVTGARSAGQAVRTAVLKTTLYTVGHPLALEIDRRTEDAHELVQPNAPQ